MGIAGTRIGPYEIQSELGRGGMGVVYRARQLSLNRDVALKVLPSNPLLPQENLERFLREGASIAQVTHPNIVQVYDVGEAEGIRYIAMELVTGGTVTQRLEKSGAFSYRDAAQVATQMAGALGALHAKGLVHRDIKPSNILLTGEEGAAKLTDFGVALLQDEPEDQRLTLTRAAVGTPQYMSPEQVLAKEALTGASDVYSLGVVLYEMLAGRHPWAEATVNEAMIKQVGEALPPIRRYREDIPDDLERLLQKCLEKDRTHRPKDGGALRAALNPILLRLEMEALQAGPATGKYQAQVTGTGMFYSDAAVLEHAQQKRQLARIAREALARITDPHKRQRHALQHLQMGVQSAREKLKATETQLNLLRERQKHHEDKAARAAEKARAAIAAGQSDEVDALAGEEKHHRQHAEDYKHQATETGRQAADERTTYDQLRASAARRADELALADAQARRRGVRIPEGAQDPTLARKARVFALAAGAALLLLLGAVPAGLFLLRSGPPAPTPLPDEPPVIDLPPVEQPVRVEIPPPARPAPVEVRDGMTSRRTYHGAVPLNDSEVFLIGGLSRADEHIASTELFDLKTRTSRARAPMNTPRSNFSATLLEDGRVLVVGGYNRPSGWLRDAELYDPKSDRWTVVPSLFPHGTSHSATRLEDGRVLVAGGAFGSGSGGISDRVELFDPRTSTWLARASLPRRLSMQTATLLADGRILLAGGHDGAQTQAFTYLYDVKQDRWEEIPGTQRHYQRGVRLNDGRVLVAGGADWDPRDSGRTAEIFNPSTRAWQPAASMKVSRLAHTMTLLKNGKVLVTGGDHVPDLSSPINTCELYDPAENTWTELAPLEMTRCMHTATLLPDGRVFIAGGQGAGWEVRSSVEFYLPGAKAAPDLTRELVLHLPFDKDEKASVSDASTSRLRGDVQGAVYVPEGRIGGACSFDGVDDWIVFPRHAALELGNSLTLAAWMKPTDYRNQNLVMQWESWPNWVAGVQFATGVRGGQWGGKGAGANLISRRNENLVISAPNPPAGEWHHMAVTYEAASGKAYVYIDGALAAEKSFGALSPDTALDLCIGGSRAEFGPPLRFRGLLDEVRVYRRALSPEEVQQLAAPPGA